MNTPVEARDFLQARADSGAQYGPGHCLGAMRDAYFGAGEHAWGGTAASAYAATTRRSSGPAPFGVLLWWTGGSEGAGHVAFSLGDGTCLTTDFGPQYIGDGRIRRVPIAGISAHDPALVFKGWSWDFDGFDIREDQLFVFKRSSVAQKYAYFVDFIRPISDVAVNHIGAEVHTLPDNDFLFSLPQTIPAALLPAPATASGTWPHHDHPLVGKTGVNP